jgi:putative DNA primase/helicase
MTDFFEIASRNAERGFKVHPLHPRDKRPLLKDWPSLATSDKAQIEIWAEQFRQANCGVIVDGARCVLESDALDRFQQLLGLPLPRTFTVQARENRPHFYFLQTEKSRELGNCDLAGIFEFKQDRRFVVAEGSTHPTGAIYRVIDASPEIAIPDWLVGRLITIYQEHTRNGNGRNAAPVEGGRNNYLTSVAGKLRHAGLSKEALELALLQHNDDICNPPLSEEEVRSIARSVARYDVPEPTAEVTIGGPELKTESARAVSPQLGWSESTYRSRILPNCSAISSKP